MLDFDDKLYNALLGYINEGEYTSKERCCKIIGEKLAEIHAEKLNCNEIEYRQFKADFTDKFEYILMGK